MNRFILFLVIACCILDCSKLQAEPDTTVKVIGHFNGLSNETISLLGFNGFDTYEIASAKIDSSGHFTLNFPSSALGAAYLISADQSPFLLVLEKNNIQLSGFDLRDHAQIKIESGPENKLYEKWVSEHPQRKNAIEANSYLEQLYARNPSLQSRKFNQNTLIAERSRLLQLDQNFIKKIPEDYFIKWYLPQRSFINSIPAVAQLRPHEIPLVLKEMRTKNYSDNRWYSSGLLRESIESHFWLLENSGLPLDSIFTEMTISIDSLLGPLFTEKNKLDQIARFLFDLCEKNSWQVASQHLALRLLNQNLVAINPQLASRLEAYRAMRIGQTAPNISFGELLLHPSLREKPQRLSDLKARYKVLVFGSSWCNACPTALSKIVNHYPDWKKMDIEVIFISLDHQADNFISTCSAYPFLSTTDLQGWDSPVVKSYHVGATPTFYILSTDLEIKLRPTSVEQINAWINAYVR